MNEYCEIHKAEKGGSVGVCARCLWDKCLRLEAKNEHLRKVIKWQQQYAKEQINKHYSPSSVRVEIIKDYNSQLAENLGEEENGQK